MLGLLVLSLFCLVLLLRVPVSASMIIASLVVFIIGGDVPLVAIPQFITAGMDSFELLAVPFFILAAELMNVGGMTERIFRLALGFVGRVPGGLAQVNIVASIIFAGISGSALADAAGLGRVEIKAMSDAGYDREFASAVTLASCIVGPIIPPSIILIVYAILAQASVGSMLIAGLIPGLLLGFMLMIYVYFVARSGRYSCPIGPKPTRRELVRYLWEGLPALVAPAIIVIGIVSGVFTPTEAGLIACLYSFIISTFIYREMTFKKLVGALKNALLSSGMIMFLIGAATLLAHIVTREQIAMQIAQMLGALTKQVWLQLLLINVFLLFVGCLIEGVPAILILVPVLLPVVEGIGISPIHFGVLLSLNLLIGIITPPMGVGLFVVSNYTGISFERLTRACLPFLIPLLITLGIVTYVPQVSLCLVEAIFK
jgi:tripartite ATP-independent transporter DctM subunit